MAKKLSLLILSIILVLVILSTTTYALFFKQDKLENEESYTAGMLDIVLDNNEEGLGDVLNLANAIPLSDSDGKSTTPYSFKITNQGNLSYTFDLKIVSTTTDNAIDSSYIKVMIDDEEPVTLRSLTNSVIKSNITLAPSNSVTISVRIWLDEYTPNTQIGKTFSAKIVTDGVASEPPMEANKYIMRLSQGNTWSSGAEGLYEVSYTKEDGTTIGKDYRYIGAEADNFIRFNNDLYQIIGVFDENTHGIEGEYLVKLISADLLSVNSWGVVNTGANTGTYSNYYNDWTGKQYTTSANANILLNQYFLNKANTSDTYGNCSNWSYYDNNKVYRNNNCNLIVGYGITGINKNFIETTVWHLNGYNNVKLTADHFYLCERGIYTNCTSANNGAGDTTISAKIGLMYVSDYMYASGYYASNSSYTAYELDNAIDNWLYQGQEWTIVPQNDSTNKALYVSNLGRAETLYTNTGNGIRPVFYLKSNVKIVGGEGTIDNPYTIE